MAKSIRVLIVEDHDMARMGLSVILGNCQDIEIAGMCADGLDGVNNAITLKPNVVIMDIGLPTMDGIEATKHIRNLDRSDAKKIPIIAIDIFKTEYYYNE